MPHRNRCLLALPVLAGILGAGCHGGPEPTRATIVPAASNLGRLTLTLQNDGFGSDASELKLDILGVELGDGQGHWVRIPLADPVRTVDLLAAHPESLADAAAVPAGTYHGLRVRLGARHTARFGNGASERCSAPAELHSDASLVVAGGGPTRCALLVDVHAALARGRTGALAFEPGLLEARDQAQTGSIRGRLCDQETGAPLAGMVVTAQRVAVPAPPQMGPVSAGPVPEPILRSTTSGPDGGFSLDLLPVGLACRVVALSEAGPRPHAPACSQVLRPGAAPVLQDLQARAMDGAPGSVEVKGFPQKDNGQPECRVRLERAFDSGFQAVLGGAKLHPHGSHVFAPLAAGSYRISYEVAWPKAGVRERLRHSATCTVAAGATTTVIDGR